MKKAILLVVLSVTVVMFMTNCNGLKKMIQNADDINYKVTPEVLEMHNGKVNVAITGNFPEKYFNKKVTATLTPTLVWEGGEKALTPINVEGEKISGNAKVINYKAGGAFSYNETFDYNPAMRRSKLELRITGQYKKKVQDFPAEFLADGIVATPDLVQMVGNSSNAKDQFVKDIPDTKAGHVSYDKNKWELKKDATYNDIKAYIESTKDAENRLELKGVKVTSFTSPEGTQDFNQKVVDSRDNTAQNLIKKDYKGMNESMFSYLKTNQDWEGFKKAVQESNLADKDMILRVVNMNSDPVKREQEIRNMTKTFADLEQYIMPLLRKSELAVSVMKIGHTDSEIEQIYNEDPSKLTLEELLYLGSKTKDLDKQLAIYTKVTELYPKEWRGFNNLAAVQYAKKNYTAAKTAIEKAKSLGANATILNNLANIQLQEGNITDAETNYKAATGVPEASAGQGVIAIKKGQYSQAEQFYGSQCVFNNALAELLNKNYSKVGSTIDCGSDKETAIAYYLKAIAGARQSNNDMVFDNLRTAISKDSSLKNFAAKDVEFIKYFEDTTFKGIVK